MEYKYTDNGDIFEAVLSRNLQKLRAILTERPDEINTIDIDTGRTPLNMASAKGYYSVCEEIITRPDVDIFVQDFNGRDAMDNAYFTDRDDIIDLILDRAVYFANTPKPKKTVVSSLKP
jgi:hypothetical protein